MPVALTVDVEDWYDGMAQLGWPISPPEEPQSGLDMLTDLLSSPPRQSRVTLFVVGNYAGEVRLQLEELARAGHEIASHGPDHGSLPQSRGELADWLYRGRDTLEQLVQQPVGGFRSPRFDIPAGMGLAEFRESIARAGFRYVSDRHCLGARSPVCELPVLTRWRVPVGGGSYQRLLPERVLTSFLKHSHGLNVLYYHSYDFGATLPSPLAHRSPAVLKQVVARTRIPRIFRHLLQGLGSISCSEASVRP